MHLPTPDPTVGAAQPCTSTARIPELISKLQDHVSRGFALSTDAALLLVVQTFATAAGASVLFRHPDYCDLTPLLDLAIVDVGTSAMARGAIRELLWPLTDQQRLARTQYHANGPEQAKAYLEANLQELSEHTAKFARMQREYAEVSSVPEAETWESTNAQRRQFELRFQIPEVRHQQQAMQAAAVNQCYTVAHEVIVHDHPWRELAALSRRSFDHAVLNIVSANYALTELPGYSRRDKETLARTMECARYGLPIPAPDGNSTDLHLGTVLIAEQAILSRVMKSPGIAEGRFFSGFLFVRNADPDSVCEPDPKSVLAINRDEEFRQVLGRIFQERRIRSGRAVLLDAASFRDFARFRSWCFALARESSEELHPFIRELPNIALRIALVFALVENKVGEETIEPEYVVSACTVLTRMAGEQISMLEQLRGTDAAQLKQKREQEIERLLLKMQGRGSMSMRALVRTYNRQDYGYIRALLNDAIAQGLVIEEVPDLFRAVNVSASVSVTNKVVSFEKGVGE